MVGGLSRNEAEMGERTEHLLALVEETEFGIALPTTLRILSREMRSIEGWLKAGDVSARNVDMEKRIEEDLLGLAEAVRRLSPSTPPAPGEPLPQDLKERERELNRLIAELKMVRMLQFRLTDDTVVVDKTRGARITVADRHQAARSRRWNSLKTRSATRLPRSPNDCRPRRSAPSDPEMIAGGRS